MKADQYLTLFEGLNSFLWHFQAIFNNNFVCQMRQAPFL